MQIHRQTKENYLKAVETEMAGLAINALWFMSTICDLKIQAPLSALSEVTWPHNRKSINEHRTENSTDSFTDKKKKE